MTTFTNAAPQAILYGVKDESGRPPVYEAEQNPSFMVHAYTFAERGDTLPQLVIGDSMTRAFGANTFDLRSKYANHQTPLINILSGNANQVMLQRVVPEDAKTATLRLSIDIVADLIPQYQRSLTGGFVLGPDGNRIPLPGEPAPGYRWMWVLESIAANEVFGQAPTRVGTLVSSTDVASQLYPIHEFQLASAGSYGDNVGIRLYAPTSLSGVPVNDSLALDQKTYLNRLVVIERDDASTTPNVVETLSSETYVDFAYKEGAIDKANDLELFADDVILQGWEQKASRGVLPVRGRFGKMHVYYANLEAVLGKVQAAEAPFGLVPVDDDSLYLVNLLGGTDLYGVPYYAGVVEGPSSGGVLMSENSNHYAAGGTDGTMTAQTFDALVANQVANYGDLQADLMDDAVYPQSMLIDTGFTMDTKKKLLVPMGRRKDIGVLLSTQDVLLPQNTASQETSAATVLRSAARLYPESEVYGTPVCRAMIIGHSGYLVGMKWKQLACLTLDFADKCSKYMGAGNGIWKPAAAFDMPPANQVSLFRDVNCSYKKADQRTRDWATGLVWVQSYDRSSLFTPAYQTVYDDDTSILNAAPNMFVAIELEKIAQRTWRDLAGISKLTPAQFIARSNRLIAERAKDRFDDRVIIVPETFMAANDTQRGYSWACRINMYGNNMLTVGQFTIVARRREDLTT